VASTINVHSHYQPEAVAPLLETLGIGSWEERDGVARFVAGDIVYEIPIAVDEDRTFWGSGLAKRLPGLDEAGIDVTVLMPSPMVFNYQIDAAANDRFSRAFNDATAEHIAEHPTRFWGAAQLPMQDLELAAKELERAVRELGLKGCAVGYALGATRTLADPACDEFLSTVERLDVPILLHPVALGQSMDLKRGGGEWLLEHQMDWAFGYLFVEMAAIVGFIFSGALDRHPGLRLMIPHGGGILPYQIGRLKRFAEIFRGPTLARSIDDYIDQHFWFDTVLHDDRALGLLVEVVGEDNVVMGSNFPGWDDFRSWELIRGSERLSATAKEKILGANAEHRLFKTRLPVA
jgi:aminocarboxymuconate-semialdehyde decarboxylase